MDTVHIEPREYDEIMIYRNQTKAAFTRRTAHACPPRWSAYTADGDPIELCTGRRAAELAAIRYVDHG